MYGRADGMPSFQLPVAVRDELAMLFVYIDYKQARTPVQKAHTPAATQK